MLLFCNSYLDTYFANKQFRQHVSLFDREEEENGFSNILSHSLSILKMGGSCNPLLAIIIRKVFIKLLLLVQMIKLLPILRPNITVLDMTTNDKTANM